MEFFLASFGLHNPYIVTKLPEHAIYPVSDSSGDAIDLDYTSLLLGKKYIVDKQAFDYVCSGAKSFLAPMATTMKILHKEGLLEIIDVEEIVRRNIDSLRTKVEALSASAHDWVGPLRRQWAGVKDEFAIFHRRFGSPEFETANTQHFAVLNYLALLGEETNSARLQELTRILESRRKTLSGRETEIVTGILKPLLAQILINDLVRTETKKPILDWDDNRFYYDQLYLAAWDAPLKELSLQSAARRLFEVIIPNLKPRDVYQVIEFISNDKAVASLQAELWRRIETDGDLDDAWYKELTDRLLAHEISMKKKMKKFRWLGAVLSSMIPGGSIIQEAGIEVAQNLAEDEMEKRLGRNFEWYYALQGLHGDKPR